MCRCEATRGRAGSRFRSRVGLPRFRGLLSRGHSEERSQLNSVFPPCSQNFERARQRQQPQCQQSTFLLPVQICQPNHILRDSLLTLAIPLRRQAGRQRSDFQSRTRTAQPSTARTGPQHQVTSLLTLALSGAKSAPYPTLVPRHIDTQDSS